MSLTNAQYNSIMKDYEQTRDRNRHLTEQRRLEVYTKLPEYGRLDESVGELSVAQAKLLLNRKAFFVLLLLYHVLFYTGLFRLNLQ